MVWNHQIKLSRANVATILGAKRLLGATTTCTTKLRQDNDNNSAEHVACQGLSLLGEFVPVSRVWVKALPGVQRDLHRTKLCIKERPCHFQKELIVRTHTRGTKKAQAKAERG